MSDLTDPAHPREGGQWPTWMCAGLRRRSLVQEA